MSLSVLDQHTKKVAVGHTGIREGREREVIKCSNVKINYIGVMKAKGKLEMQRCFNGRTCDGKGGKKSEKDATKQIIQGRLDVMRGMGTRGLASKDRRRVCI